MLADIPQFFPDLCQPLIIFTNGCHISSLAIQFSILCLPEFSLLLFNQLLMTIHLLPNFVNITVQFKLKLCLSIFIVLLTSLQLFLTLRQIFLLLFIRQIEPMSNLIQTSLKFFHLYSFPLFFLRFPSGMIRLQIL